MSQFLEECLSLKKYVKFQPGDINGFLQLFFDNLGTILGLIGATLFSGFQLGSFGLGGGTPKFDATVENIVFARAIPGIGFTMVFGNLYYAWMGLKLMKKKDEEGDVSPTTALPYGVNTPGAFAFVFNILLPLSLALMPDCAGDDDCLVDAAETVWRAGVVANFIAGLISMVLGLAGNYIPYVTPTLGLLTALAGIGISFLGIGFLAKNFAEPLAGLLPFFLIFMTYFADVSFGPVPISLVIIVIGSILGWADGVLTPEDLDAAVESVQVWGASEGFSALGDWSNQADFIGTTFPVAIAAAAGSLMNVYSARKAGDDYGIREVMISDGFGTIVAALFGTPYGTSVYIGHPAYKKMGAGIMYSVMNCVFIFFFSIFGIFGLLQGLIPETTVAPLLVFVGISICKEAMEEAKPRHYPAYMIGILPDFVRWVLQQGANYDPTVGNFGHFGLVALSRSSLLVSLILCSICIYFSDRNFFRATIWLIIASLFSLIGLIHQAKIDFTNIMETVFEGGDSCFSFGYCSGPNNFILSPTDWLEWEKAAPIRFFGGYLMTAAVSALFYLSQKYAPEGMFKVPPPIEDADMEPEFKETMSTAAI